MLRIIRSRYADVALGLITGRFDTAQVLQEVDRAYAAGDLSPGLDSVVMYEPGIEVGHVSVADLCAIRDRVARHEGTCLLPYRSILIAAEREAEIVTRVYAATWQGALMPPTHHIVTSLEEAEARLALCAVAKEFDSLRRSPFPHHA